MVREVHRGTLSGDSDSPVGSNLLDQVRDLIVEASCCLWSMIAPTGDTQLVPAQMKSLQHAERGGVPLQRLNRRVCAGQRGCGSSQSAQSPQDFSTMARAAPPEEPLTGCEARLAEVRFGGFVDIAEERG